MLVKNKAHLTPKGLEHIKLIKSGMNRGRVNNERRPPVALLKKQIQKNFLDARAGCKARSARLASGFNKETSLTQKITYVKMSSFYSKGGQYIA